MTDFNVFAAFFVVFITLTCSETVITEEEASKESLRKVALANNELAFNLLRKLTPNTSENVFISPLSITTAFNMLFYGTRGETAQELRKALGYEKADLANELVFESLSLYLREVLKNDNSSNGYVLDAANAIFVDEKMDLLQDYRLNVQELFNAEVRNVDFAKEAPRIVKEINTWVKEKTNGKIEKLFDELSPSTALVLLNAVYFKGKWKTQFDPEQTTEEVFYNNGTDEKSVQMMYKKSRFPYASFEDFQALEMPYQGDHVSMLILLPNNRDGLKDLEESLNPEKMINIQRQLYSTKVDVWLPKFKLQFKKELSTEMQQLGANQIFGNGGNFSGMTDSRNLRVSQVLHKAVVEVNEEGSEAAAVTGIVVVYSASILFNNPEFRVDHPFLFAIVEKGSNGNMILFLGHVNHL